MSRVFLDVNVPMYAGGVEHPLRAPSQRIIMAVASDQLDAVTDAEVPMPKYFRSCCIGICISTNARRVSSSSMPSTSSCAAACCPLRTETCSVPGSWRSNTGA